MPEQPIPSILPHPDTSTSPGATPISSVRRTSKIARLPRKLRNLINAALDDGATYGAIVQQLAQSSDPPLPYPISERNLSDWHRAGYQDWLRHQDHLTILSTRLEDVFDLVHTTDPAQFQQTAIHMANLRLVEYLSQFAITDPEADPKLYYQLLSILPRIARESLNLLKHRDAQALAQSQAQAKNQNQPSAAPVPETPAQQEARIEAAREALLDDIDEVFGLTSYHRKTREWNPPVPHAPETPLSQAGGDEVPTATLNNTTTEAHGNPQKVESPEPPPLTHDIQAHSSSLTTPSAAPLSQAGGDEAPTATLNNTTPEAYGNPQKVESPEPPPSTHGVHAHSYDIREQRNALLSAGISAAHR
jgi:hypothetical protein